MKTATILGSVLLLTAAIVTNPNVSVAQTSAPNVSPTPGINANPPGMNPTSPSILPLPPASGVQPDLRQDRRDTRQDPQDLRENRGERRSDRPEFREDQRSGNRKDNMDMRSADQSEQTNRKQVTP